MKLAREVRDLIETTKSQTKALIENEKIVEELKKKKKTYKHQAKSEGYLKNLLEYLASVFREKSPRVVVPFF